MTARPRRTPIASSSSATAGSGTRSSSGVASTTTRGRWSAASPGWVSDGAAPDATAPVISLAIRSLAARPGRTVLSALGIALGVALLYASLATDAGIAASVDRTVRDLVGRADLRIESFGPNGLSPAALAEIEAAPGVTDPAAALERRTYLLPASDASADGLEPV